MITNCSFGKLSAHVLKTDCSSAYVLCLCGGLGSSLLLYCRALASLSATSFTVCLNCGFSAFRFLRCNRPGFFSSLELLNCLLYLLLFRCCCSSSDFLTVCTLFFNSAPFSSSVAFLAIFCIGVTSHRCDSLDSVCALTWLSHFVISVAVDTSSIMDVYLCACAVLSISSVLLSV